MPKAKQKMQKGKISVQTENIFPIIKKFLYSDHEIFLRELISNAIDATNKIKVLAARGEYDGELGDLTIQVSVDPEAKTLTIADRGIGMTADEVKKYLNQVAFSSAQEFLEKYNDESIIGNFGLGFYSSYMVANQVEVVSKSYQEDAPGITWVCDGEPEYTLKENDKTERGTEIILHINDEENQEFLEKSRIEGILKKYCSFLPVEIQFGMREETRYEGEGDDRKEIKEEHPNIINETHPLWKKQPSELKDEDYKSFYQKLYPFSQEPMFWIHLNIDYPFNLTGILYFPKLSNSLEIQKNKIQLYSNQVYVTDEVKEIVPEFLTLLHGVIDSPDIPLNVSRSYLQSDQNVKKITGYITRKVADKLEDLYKKDKDNYISKWDDIGVFVKYGMISEEKFYDKALKFALFKNANGNYFTIDEYKDKIKELQTDKHSKVVCLYAHHDEIQTSYIKAAENQGYDVLIMDHVIDNHYMQHLEHKLGDLLFVRVDSDTVDNLIQKDEKQESVLTEKQEEKVKKLFENVLDDKSKNLSLRAMSPNDHPVVITKPEFLRRMQEMQTMQGNPPGMGMGMDEFYNIVVNTNHPLIAEKLINMRSAEKKNGFATYLFNLARLNQNMLKGEELSKFIETSLEFVK